MDTCKSEYEICVFIKKDKYWRLWIGILLHQKKKRIWKMINQRLTGKAGAGPSIIIAWGHAVRLGKERRMLAIAYVSFYFRFIKV